MKVSKKKLGSIGVAAVAGGMPMLVAPTAGAAPETPMQACQTDILAHAQAPVSFGGRTYYFTATRSKGNNNCNDTNIYSASHAQGIKGRYFIQSEGRWTWGDRSLAVLGGNFPVTAVITELKPGTSFRHGGTFRNSSEGMAF